jgi:hypothetical protein
MKRFRETMLLALPFQAPIDTELAVGEASTVAFPAILGSLIDIQQSRRVLLPRADPRKGLAQRRLNRRWQGANIVVELSEIEGSGLRSPFFNDLP